MIRRPPRSTLFPHPTRFRSSHAQGAGRHPGSKGQVVLLHTILLVVCGVLVVKFLVVAFWMQDQTYQRAARLNMIAALICLGAGDRKSTRLNSSHANISYAVF